MIIGQCYTVYIKNGNEAYAFITEPDRVLRELDRVVGTLKTERLKPLERF